MVESKIENNTIEPNSPPIHIIASSTPERKMKAIENLSLAILECAKALNSTNAQITISHCNIVGAETGFKIDG